MKAFREAAETTSFVPKRRRSDEMLYDKKLTGEREHMPVDDPKSEDMTVSD